VANLYIITKRLQARFGISRAPMRDTAGNLPRGVVANLHYARKVGEYGLKV
jgi:hypothetical protein